MVERHSGKSCCAFSPKKALFKMKYTPSLFQLFAFYPGCSLNTPFESAFFRAKPHARCTGYRSRRFDHPYRVSDYANGHHFLRESSHGRTYKEQLNFLLHGFRPVTMATCDVSLRLLSVFLRPHTSHTVDGRRHSCHGFVSMLCRSVSLLRGHGHRFRSVCFPASHVPHKTSRPLGWDSR